MLSLSLSLLLKHTHVVRYAEYKAEMKLLDATLNGSINCITFALSSNSVVSWCMIHDIRALSFAVAES